MKSENTYYSFERIERSKKLKIKKEEVLAPS